VQLQWPLPGRPVRPLPLAQQVCATVRNGDPTKDKCGFRLTERTVLESSIGRRESEKTIW